MKNWRILTPRYVIHCAPWRLYVEDVTVKLRSSRYEARTMFTLERVTEAPFAGWKTTAGPFAFGVWSIVCPP